MRISNLWQSDLPNLKPPQYLVSFEAISGLPCRSVAKVDFNGLRKGGSELVTFSEGELRWVGRKWVYIFDGRKAKR